MAQADTPPPTSQGDTVEAYSGLAKRLTLSSPATAIPLARAIDRTLSGHQRIALVLVSIELALLYAPTLLWLWERWTISVWQNAHGLLIVPFAVFLMYRELQPRQSAPAQPNPWGFAIVVPAVGLHAIDAGMHTQLLSAASLVLLLPGLSFILLGTDKTRAILFPLLFLAFALPIPLAFTESIHWQLRQIATSATVGAMPVFGIPVFRDGTSLQLANAVVVVSDACSGFSTLYAALAVGTLAAYSTSSPIRRLLLLTLTAPIAIVANVARVILLVLLVSWRGGGILQTFVHPLSGLLTFAVAIPIILWLGGSPPGKDES